MKVIIFAGGYGTRLWPISRQNSPKQFEKMIEGKSTFQLAIERISPLVKFDDIYVSTNKNYLEILHEQAPKTPEANFILEPARRDLAPAVGLSFMKLFNDGYHGSVAILWADHTMKNTDLFRNALQTGDQLISENPDQFIFLGEKPVFANHNLGWITVGDEIEKRNDFSILEFKKWDYRPQLSYCQEMHKSGKSFWNPGYFVTSVKFVIELYKTHLNDMYQNLKKIVENPKLLEEIYPTLESISFDDGIVTKTKPNQAKVIKVDLGWNDPGTLYALKTVLAEAEKDNAVKGEVETINTTDSLIFNYEKDKIVTTIGLEGYVVVNMKDALLVVHKNYVPDVKNMVNQLKEKGLEKYI